MVICSSWQSVLKSGVPSIWHPATNWLDLLTAKSEIEALYLTRQLKGVDELHRAAACIALLQAECGSSAPAPLRAHKIATNSIKTFEQMCHAAWAGLEFNKALDKHNTLEASFKHASAAWRHINTAGVWQHEQSCCPPQLTELFKKRVIILLLILMYHRTSAASVMDRTEDLCVKQVAMLHAIIEHGCEQPLRTLALWATEELALVIAHCWATYHRDPRRQNIADETSDDAMAFAVCKLINADSPSVAQFLRTHSLVVGGNLQRLQEVQRKGRDGFLNAVLNSQQLLERCRLSEMSNPIDLPGKRSFTTVTPFDAEGMPHAVVYPDIGVVLPTNEIKIAPAPKKPTWFSWKAPSFSMGGSTAPPPKSVVVQQTPDNDSAFF